MKRHGRPGARAAPWARTARVWVARVWAAVAPLVLGGATASDAQAPPVRIVGASGAVTDVRPTFDRADADRAHAAVPASALEALGWRVATASGEWRLELPGGERVVVSPGSPLLAIGPDWVQLVDAPYVEGGTLFVPLQVLLDVLPTRWPGRFAVEGDSVLRVLGPDGVRPDRGRRAAPEPVARGEPPAERRGGDPGARQRVVVIDAGHGGDDPGAIGPGGVREKDVALAVALELQRALEKYEWIDVRLTRSRDTLVHIWGRGAWATEVKGERPGVFVSLHANALRSNGVRGFETYFLSEARTDHERRVAANENAPLAMDGGGGLGPESPDLDFILKELRNLDQQHWSALLAELVQDRLDPVHPGPNRGVKQAPLAVITNAIMPAVLIELGFITNPSESRLLASADFQRGAARAIEEALIAFFGRYPPGADRAP